MQLARLLDDATYIAGQLGVPAAEVRLGPNRSANGNVQAWNNGAPEHFDYQWSTNADGNRQVYFGGLDWLWRNAARIIALNQPAIQGTDHAYAEYISGPIDLAGGSYLVTLRYCLPESRSGEALVYLGQYDKPGATLLHEPLASTRGGCGLGRYIVNNSADLAGVRLLTRNWGVGDFAVSDLALRKIE